MTATQHLNMPVFGLGSANGEAVFLVEVDDVFFFDFFEDGWHGMKEGGISHFTDLISLRQWGRLSLRIGICARMKVVSGFLQIRSAEAWDVSTRVNQDSCWFSARQKERTPKPS